MSEKILVGQKPSMTYVLNAVSRLKNEKEFDVLARGKNISKAVDVAEMLRKRFMENLEIDKIEIDTETYTDKDNKERKTSAISIRLKVTK